jgi:hypothetical protein
MISVLSVLACVLAMTCSFLVARGKLRAVYLLGIVNGLVYCLLNALLAASGQPFVLFLMVPSAWGVAMSVLGLLRLRRLGRLRPRSATDVRSPAPEAVGRYPLQPATAPSRGADVADPTPRA